MNLLRILMILILPMFALSGCLHDDDDYSPPPANIGGDNGGDSGGDDDTSDDDDGPIAFNRFVIDQFGRDPASDPVALNGMEFEFDNTDPDAFDEVLNPSSQ